MTLTALKPRPTQAELNMVHIEVVKALPEDFKVHDSYANKDKLRYGMIYWLKASKTDKFEQTPRILTKNSNLKEIEKWFGFGMIYIAKSCFLE